jgi:hypothetical protein
MELEQQIGRKGFERITVPAIIAELNEIYAVAQYFDDGTHLAAPQAFVRHVLKQRHDRQ